MRIMLKSKIRNVKINDACIKYEGSITIDKRLMKLADIVPYEQVHVLDVTNGKRFVTYAIEGNDGDICVNGAASLLVNIGDEVTILAYGIVQRYASLVPKVINGQTFKSTAS